MKTDTNTIVAALKILSHDIQSSDGIANACIEEASSRLKELSEQVENLKDQRDCAMNIIKKMKTRNMNELVSQVRLCLKDQRDCAMNIIQKTKARNMNELVSQVRLWGEEKGITGKGGKATPTTQFEKLEEEVNEVREGLKFQDQHAVIDGIGDCTVVLILLSELIGVPFEDCLQAAYDEIKGRTGIMVDGKFVKDNAKSDSSALAD
jgi:NTP pyrophosphatase (non-canonical NTP hydrolase)